MNEGVNDMWWETKKPKPRETLRVSVFEMIHRFFRNGEWYFTCHYCQEDFLIKWLTKDHKVAKINGGMNRLSNYLPACSKCNSEKGSMRYDVYMDFIKKRK
jgi:5-methylcytosine-specific restriction endonuclease McrA